MNRELAMRVADAVMYEGYMLYPYRPSAVKNRQRWSFGILYPPDYSEVRGGTERAQMHSECLLQTTGDARVHIQLRFLHLRSRKVAAVVDGQRQPADTVVVDERRIESWDEGVERSQEFEVAVRDGVRQSFGFRWPGLNEDELLCDHAGAALAEIRRSQQELQGAVSVSASRIRDELVKLTIDVNNETPLPEQARDRTSALLHSLISAHTILTVDGGEFISLLDPPDHLRQEISACRNIGNFPVLVGGEGEHDMVLCSPIVLYDYPQIAPESAGDFYDATEMDEMLTLRVTTLTDAEKDEMRLADDRVRSLLQRTEQSAREQLMRTHGTIRSMRPVSDKP